MKGKTQVQELRQLEKYRKSFGQCIHELKTPVFNIQNIS